MNLYLSSNQVIFIENVKSAHKYGVRADCYGNVCKTKRPAVQAVNATPHTETSLFLSNITICLRHLGALVASSDLLVENELERREKNNKGR